MNKKYILLGILFVVFFSGCIENENLINASEIQNFGENRQVYSIYPLIYGERIEVVFPNNVGKYVYSESYMKFRDGNNTCYTYLGSSAAGNSVSCVKD